MTASGPAEYSRSASMRSRARKNLDLAPRGDAHFSHLFVRRRACARLALKWLHINSCVPCQSVGEQNCTGPKSCSMLFQGLLPLARRSKFSRPFRKQRRVVSSTPTIWTSPFSEAQPGGLADVSSLAVAVKALALLSRMVAPANRHAPPTLCFGCAHHAKVDLPCLPVCNQGGTFACPGCPPGQTGGSWTPGIPPIRAPCAACEPGKYKPTNGSGASGRTCHPCRLVVDLPQCFDRQTVQIFARNAQQANPRQVGSQCQRIRAVTAGWIVTTTARTMNVSCVRQTQVLRLKAHSPMPVSATRATLAQTACHALHVLQASTRRQRGLRYAPRAQRASTRRSLRRSRTFASIAWSTRTTIVITHHACRALRMQVHRP